ncbi:winged helix-turn-helix domain-containing protein [Staphylothermus hellenicus]|uniref:ArnR1-like winged helix-turn-helix domain-containing protein n=1 Tax=Staphylothermus hellenicus (strain DSM 12710 / JCM 10830 / BK20S6-10-b1 / P8) TaxID=591019 RepID=D7DBM8_STAHD|nr:winged helix-turn-helix domain-containing protein [Staphylothermus hellenicus]ADI31575.1 hypothetical protein Shell_0444 [Staphylothermus hellenicus DSM 12710]
MSLKKEYNVSTKQIEMMAKILNIIKNKDIPVFSVKDLMNEYPYLSYNCIYMRLKRLGEKGFVKRITRGGYIVTEKGKEFIQEIEKMLSKTRL